MAKANVSYSLGAYPTIDLLKYRPGEVSQVYVSSRIAPALLSQIKELFPSVAVNDKLIAKLSKSENTYVVGEFRKYETQLDAAASHLVLCQAGDMGNLGTIIRAMSGFGISDLAVIRPAADIFHPKTIRASMGSVFQINFQYFDTFEDYQLQYPQHNFYPFMSDAKCSMQNAKFIYPYSLIFGNEATGLPDSFSSIGTPVRIEQTANIDSLNLSIAASLGLYHAFVSHQKS